MKILLLTQWFDPEPTFKGLVFARELKRRGHDVEVLTGFPNYPGGKVYPGYKIRAYEKSEVEGVVVHRVALYPSHDSSALKRILNYGSFAASALFFGLFKVTRPDLIYVYHPPMTVGLAGAGIGLLRRVPFVYDIQDLWPDTLQATGMINNAKALKVVSRVCDWIYRRAAHVVVLSDGFKHLLIKRGVPEKKIDVIYNWCDEAALLSAPAKQASDFGLVGGFNILFAGTMGKAQALDPVLDAAAITLKSHPAIRFAFVGGGIEKERLTKAAADRNLSNVVLLPRMEMNEVGSLLKACDVLLVHLRKDPLFEITIPSKTQAYLAIGKPIIMGVPGDAASLVERSNSGLVIPPESAQALAEAAIKLSEMRSDDLADMGKRGRQFYDETLSLNQGVTKFLSVFTSILSRGGSSR